MSDALRLVGFLFLRGLPTVVFVIILLAILDRLFFRPIAGVMKKRTERTVGALDRAREQVKRAEGKSREYVTALNAARAEIYRQRQAEHQDAMKERDRALGSARERAEHMRTAAEEEIAAEKFEAERQLFFSCQRLAGEIADKLVGADPGSVSAPEGGVEA
ncbi:MAG: ATP synthase F0 subunit B [Terriglobia bacterium]